MGRTGRKRRWRGGLLTALTLAAVLVVPPVNAAPTDLPDLRWPPQDFLNQLAGFGVASDAPWWRAWSTVSINVFDDTLNHGVGYNCVSFTDPECVRLFETSEHATWEFSLLSPPCSQAVTGEQCIEGLAVTSPSGERRIADLVGMAPGPTFPGVPEIGLPQGPTASVFDDPFSDDSADVLAVALTGGLGRDWKTGLPDKWDYPGPMAPMQSLIGTITAVRLVPGDYQAPRMACGEHGCQVDYVHPNPCAFTGDGYCAWTVAPRMGYSMELAFRTQDASRTNFQAGREWIGARLTRSTVTTERLLHHMVRYRVSGEPVAVPMIAGSTTRELASPELRAFWERYAHCDAQAAAGQDCWARQVAKLSGGSLPSMATLDAFTEVLGDRSSLLMPAWSFETIDGHSGLKGAQHCDHLRDGRIIGLIATNAPLYAPGPPTLQDGALRYRVAGLHYSPDGSVFQGTYDLSMDAAYVRCLYYLTKAPVSASVEILSEGTQDLVATTTVTERAGRILLTAQGFAFSQPVLSVQFTGKSKRLTTITCKRGKRIMKVTGINPRCPKGWTRVP